MNDSEQEICAEAIENPAERVASLLDCAGHNLERVLADINTGRPVACRRVEDALANVNAAARLARLGSDLRLRRNTEQSKPTKEGSP